MASEIYFFSGTGNSFYEARELEKRLSEATLMPIVGLLGRDSVKTSTSTVGFVFPIYLNSLPSQVKRFIKTLDLDSADYIFAVPTHGGKANPLLTGIWIDRILRKKGGELSLLVDISMTVNTPTGLTPSFIKASKKWANSISEEKINSREAEVQNRLQTTKEKIEGKVSGEWKERVSLVDGAKEWIFRVLPDTSGKKIDFYADSDCTSCGICEDVCLSGRVKMVNDRPTWQEDATCYHCYACFNFCPQQAILLKNYTEKKGRYVHPEISAEDIASQKPK